MATPFNQKAAPPAQVPLDPFAQVQMRNELLFPNAGNPFAQGVHEGVHPHGAATPVDPFQMMFDQRQHMFDNTRSNLTRRNASGGLVNESAPQGLDAMRDIGHSWDTANQRPTNGAYGRVATDEPGPTPFDIQRGENATVIKGQHGAGMSTPFGNKSAGIPQAQEYNDGLGDLGQQLTVQGRGQNRANIDAAYNDAIIHPAQSFEQMAKPPQGQTPFSPLAQREMSRQDQIRAGGGQVPEYNSGSGVDSSNWRPYSPLYPHDQQAPDANIPPSIPGAETPTRSTFRDSSSLIPSAGRTALKGGASLFDFLNSMLWDSSAAGQMQEQVRPYTTPFSPKSVSTPSATVGDPYRPGAHEARMKARQDALAPLSFDAVQEADHFQPTEVGAGSSMTPEQDQNLQRMFSPSLFRKQEEERQLKEALMKRMFDMQNQTPQFGQLKA